MRTEKKTCTHQRGGATETAVRLERKSRIHKCGHNSLTLQKSVWCSGTCQDVLPISKKMTGLNSSQSQPRQRKRAALILRNGVHRSQEIAKLDKILKHAYLTQAKYMELVRTVLDNFDYFHTTEVLICPTEKVPHPCLCLPESSALFGFAIEDLQRKCAQNS